MLRATSLLLLLLCSPHAAAARQDAEQLKARITEAAKVYEGQWQLQKETLLPYSETSKNEYMFLNWHRDRQYVIANLLIHSAEEDAASTLKKITAKNSGWIWKQELFPPKRTDFGDEVIEWVGVNPPDEDYGYFFRKGKVVVSISSSSKAAAASFAKLVSDNL